MSESQVRRGSAKISRHSIVSAIDTLERSGNSAPICALFERRIKEICSTASIAASRDHYQEGFAVLLETSRGLREEGRPIGDRAALLPRRFPQRLRRYIKHNTPSEASHAPLCAPESASGIEVGDIHLPRSMRPAVAREESAEEESTLRIALREEFSRLPYLQQEVLRLLYLYEERPEGATHTIYETAKRLKISVEHARREERAALEKLSSRLGGKWILWDPLSRAPVSARTRRYPSANHKRPESDQRFAVDIPISDMEVLSRKEALSERGTARGSREAGYATKPPIYERMR